MLPSIDTPEKNYDLDEISSEGKAFIADLIEGANSAADLDAWAISNNTLPIEALSQSPTSFDR